jgi:cysteine desulfurase/selenocysteine lyase
LLAREHTAGRPIVYLDSAATTLKPRPVIQAVVDVMERHSANVHRAVHLLGDEATELYEGARRKVARFIGAESHEIVFVRNATEAINLVAGSYPRRGRVLVSLGEHHSNLLPWGNGEGVTRVSPGPDGLPDLQALIRELDRGKVAIVAASHISNVAGGRLAVSQLAAAAHAVGAVLVLDGAQSVPHTSTDVLDLDCDFLAFSGHKLCGPSGIGVLYGKADRLAEMGWYLHGGGTVEQVSREATVPRPVPWRFEAGTPAIEAAAGLGAAIDYLSAIGMEAVEAHVQMLCDQARTRLVSMRGVRLLGQATPFGESGPVSFTVAGSPSHMLARALSDSHGVCIRSGYHCAQRLHEHFGFAPTLRLSFYLYNQPWEVDLFFDTLVQILAHGGNPV